jgi:hypothetical protein
MKAKIVKGSDFGGVLRYVFDVGKNAKGDKNPEIVGGNMLGDSPSTLGRIFSFTEKTRTRKVAKPVWHCSLSLPPGERVDEYAWRDISAAFMAKMGFGEDHQYCVVRHSDKGSDHVHIIASRIDLGGNLWLGRNDVFKAIDATQELEREFGLVETRGLKDRGNRKTLSIGEQEKAVRIDEPPPRMVLQVMLDEIIETKPSIVEMVEEMEKRGVEVRITANKKGPSGISFNMDGLSFKGSSLGRYSCGELLKRGVTFDEARDRERLGELADEGRRRAAGDQPALEGTVGAAELAGGGGGPGVDGADEVVSGDRDHRGRRNIERMDEPLAAASGKGRDGELGRTAGEDRPNSVDSSWGGGGVGLAGLAGPGQLEINAQRTFWNAERLQEPGDHDAGPGKSLPEPDEGRKEGDHQNVDNDNHRVRGRRFNDTWAPPFLGLAGYVSITTYQKLNSQKEEKRLEKEKKERDEADERRREREEAEKAMRADIKKRLEDLVRDTDWRRRHVNPYLLRPVGLQPVPLGKFEPAKSRELNHMVVTDPESNRAFLFPYPPTDKPKPLVEWDSKCFYPQDLDERTIRLTLDLCKERWPGQAIELTGDDKFKREFRRIAAKDYPDMRLVEPLAPAPEPTPDHTPDQPRKRPRQRGGMGM